MDNQTDLPRSAEAWTERAPDGAEIIGLEMGDTAENTHVGGWYAAVVNNVKDFGVFVTLARGPASSYKADCVGLAHQSNIPNLYVPEDYRRGQAVVVQRLPDRHDQPEDKITVALVTSPSGDFLYEPDDSLYANDPLTREESAEEDETVESTSTTAESNSGQSDAAKSEPFIEAVPYEDELHGEEASEDIGMTLHVGQDEMFALVREGPEAVARKVWEQVTSGEEP
jgi:hypothetical protein